MTTMTTISSDKPISGLFEEAEKKVGHCNSKVSAYYLTLDILFSRAWLKRQATMSRNYSGVPNAEQHIDRITARLESLDAVAGRVFGTYEILEMILLQLPMKDMLLAQRVNRTFKAIIGRSIQIQRALHFISSALPASEYEHPLQSRNALLGSRARFQLDPWRLVVLGASQPLKEPKYKMYLEYELVENFCSRLKPLQRYPSHFESASWRRMLLSRPSCARVEIVFRTKGRRHLLGCTFIEHGFVTMDQVQEWLRETYSATVASDDWRRYVDVKETFRKNKDLIKP